MAILYYINAYILFWSRNKRAKLELEEILAQAVAGRTEEEKDKILESFKTYISKFCEDALVAIERLKEDGLSSDKEAGRWMTAAEIKNLGSGFVSAYIRQLLKKNEVFNSKKDGKSLSGYITPDNCGIVGLTPDVIRNLLGPEKTENYGSKIIVKINGKENMVYEHKRYGRDEVKSLLSRIDPMFESDGRIDKIIKSGKNGVLSGSELASFVEKVDGMILLSSPYTQRLLEEKLHYPYGGIVNLFKEDKLAKFVHSMQGIIDGTYIKRGELDSLVRVLSDLTGKGRERFSILQMYQKRLKDKNVMPNENLYKKFLKWGVLDDRSNESIEDTFSRFENAITGFRFYNLLKLAKILNMDWSEFKDDKMPKLIESGIVKDIGPEIGIQRGNFYVLAENRQEEVCNFLGIKYPINDADETEVSG